MKTLALAGFCALLLCGCAHQKQTQTAAKPVFQRPWVGGHFETVSTPRSLRTNDSHFGKRAALVSRLDAETPLAKGGLAESDLVLAVNGTRVRFPEEVVKAIEKNGANPAKFTIYRSGEVLEKTVTPGVEHYQNIRTVAFALALSTRFDVDIYPNPDFSLVAIGFQTDRHRLDLRDAKSKYRKALAATDRQAQTQEGWEGLRSDEGWKFWLGPIWITKNTSIISQE